MYKVSAWTLQHPENWDTSSVEGWINFVADKYAFPEDIRRKCVTRLRDVTGKQLMGMQMADFQHCFREIGELLYLAFLQIMDVGLDFEGTKVYFINSSAKTEMLAGLHSKHFQMT